MSSFNCCGSKIESQNDFEQHYLYAHFKGERGKVKFNCPFCGKSVSYYKNLPKHFQSFHFELVKSVFNPVKTQTQSASCSSNLNFEGFEDDDLLEFSDGSGEETSDQSDSSEDEDEILNLMGESFSFVDSSVQESPPLPPNSKVDLRSEIAELILKGKSHFKMTQTSIIGFLKLYNDLLLKLSPSGTLDSSILNTIHDLVKSPYQMKKTIVKNKSDVSESLIEYQAEASVNGSTNRFKFYHLPTITFVNKIFSTPHLLQKITSERVREPDRSRLQTFKDGQLFNEQQVEGANELTIQLQGFFDDFTNVKRNPKSNKFCVVILGINNLPLKHTAKRSDHFLSLIAKRKCVDAIGIDAFLKPLLEDIRSLNEQNNVFGEVLIRVKLTQFAGDNLAIHELMKLTRNFRRDSCRHCLVTYQQLQLLNPDIVITERLLNDLHCLHQHFGSSYNYSADIFHDLCHGVILKLMCFILVTFYNGDYSSLLADYKAIPVKHGRIEGIHKTTGKISGTGTQILEFFLLFSYLDSKVNRYGVHWGLYVLLREIVLFCFHPVVHEVELNQFHQNIVNFQLEFFKHIVFPTKNLSKNKKVTFVMKIHYLIHYVNAIYKCGPLLNSCTLKYERCLSGLNSFLVGSNNRKNQCFSIASWFILSFDRTAFAHCNEYRILKIVPRSEIHSNFEPDLITRFLDQSKDVELLKFCHHDNVTYKLGDLFLSDFDLNSQPLFIRITHLIKQQNQLKVIGHQFKTERYDHDRCVYFVRPTVYYQELNQQDLEYYRPVYFFEDQIVLKDFKPKSH